MEKLFNYLALLILNTKFILLSLALPVMLFAGCSVEEPHKRPETSPANQSPASSLDAHVDRIKRMISSQASSTSKGSLRAMEAFNYHPNFFDTCIKNEVDYYYTKKEVHERVTVKDCLFASRIEQIASYSVHNTRYAADILRKQAAKEKAQEERKAIEDRKTKAEYIATENLKAKNISAVHISEGFNVNKKATISRAIESVADSIGFKFYLISHDSRDYSVYQFTSRPHETPIGFLTRIDEKYPNISIKIKVEDNVIILSFLTKESLFERILKS